MAGVLARPSKIHEGILEMFDRDMEEADVAMPRTAE